MHFDPVTDLFLERHFQAKPATLWRCLTEPGLIEQWFAPRPVRVRDVVFEPWPGGAFNSVMDVPGMEEIRGSGCILAIEPERRLVWTDLLRAGWHPNSDSFGFTAVTELSAEAGGTFLRSSALHRSEAQRAEHEKMGFHEGWGKAADQLGELALSL